MRFEKEEDAEKLRTAKKLEVRGTEIYVRKSKVWLS